MGDGGVFLYVLVDPTNYTARYVGVTTSPERRESEHVNGPWCNAALKRWVLELRECGLQPRLVSLGRIAKGKWERAERRLIRSLRTFGALYNVLPGGMRGAPEQRDDHVAQWGGDLVVPRSREKRRRRGLRAALRAKKLKEKPVTVFKNKGETRRLRKEKALASAVRKFDELSADKPLAPPGGRKLLAFDESPDRMFHR